MNKEEMIKSILSQDKSLFDTRQQFFDYSMCHLYNQKTASYEKSEDCLPFCRYSTGRKSCAIGCLLIQKEYNSKMEGFSFEGFLAEKGKKNDKINNAYAETLSLFPERLRKEENIQFLADMQKFHDSVADTEKGENFHLLYFGEPASKLANEYFLNKTVISTLWGIE
jgi:hypothetical protein